MDFARQINTERLSLRALRKQDLWFFWTLIGNASVRRYLGGPVPCDQRLPRFKQYLGAPGVWVVDLDEHDRPIGLIELGPHKDGADYEISYQFHPRFWGNGFGHEAIQAIIRHGLDDTGLEQIIAETQSANLASCRLLEKQGMAEIARVQRFGAEQIIFAIT